MTWIPRKKRRRVLLFVASVLVIYFLADVTTNLVFKTRQIQPSLKLQKQTNRSAFLVDTPLCRIPVVDPFDLTIRHIVKKTGRRTCPNNASLTYEDGLNLNINWTAAELPPYYGNISYCSYNPLVRPKYEPTHNNYLRYLEESEPFNETIEVSHDFVKVTCYDLEDRSVYVNFHAFIQPNKSASHELRSLFLQHAVTDKITEPLNVVMLGMDSVSRLSFMRQMVKTRRFLEEKLGAIDMMGYNKVADNTFINIVPMTLGKFVAEMPWDESMANVPFDDFDFIWKEFAQKGYSTFYAEDAPDIAIFDFLKAGFKTPPADYFNRPVSIAMETKEDLWYNNHHCFQDRLETDIVLDYKFKFLETFQHEPHFAFTFITRLSHDDVNSAGAADEPYYKFFRKLFEKELLRNTVVFFYSDHGMRFGKIRESYIGKLEERLPFMYVIVPEWLRKTYPYLDKNLKINQHRLSTPFDVYETLKDVLYFNGKEKSNDLKSRGASWFREIPLMRSCDTAGVLPHWCTCLHHEQLNIDDQVVVKSSIVLLSEILHSLKDYSHICELLSLYKIREATRLVESEEVLKFVKSHNEMKNISVVFGERTKPLEDIQIVIQTVPGNALFEATVRLDTVYDSYKVVGDISRINVYGHQSDCIEVFKLKKYCQCKEFEEKQGRTI